ncbi:MAG TPA: hypothetical protein VGZ72_17180 [Stellaceae bacterium]|jgi:hypothetical protein|nr:hypothetical protein [Stellaceae bacterium]
MIGLAVDERLKRQRARNWAILALLAGFVALIYLVTLVKLGAF